MYLYKANGRINGNGIGLQGLSSNALHNIIVPVPPVEEQKRIVKILKNNDQIIEKYDELIKEKEQFIKSQFVEMFGNPNENNKGLEIVKLFVKILIINEYQ